MYLMTDDKCVKWTEINDVGGKRIGWIKGEEGEMYLCFPKEAHRLWNNPVLGLRNILMLDVGEHCMTREN